MILSTNDGAGGASTSYSFPFSHVGQWGSANRGSASTIATDYIAIEEITNTNTVASTTSGGCEVTSSIDFDFLYANWMVFCL